MPLLSTHIFKKICSFLRFLIYLHRCVEMLVFLPLLRVKSPLRRSRARFPLLSPTVTSSPGAGEVFPQRESQGLRLVAKVSGVKRKFPAVLLPLPLGELSPQVTERALPLPTQNAPLPCCGKRCFLRGKRVLDSLSQNRSVLTAPSGREPLAHPQTSHFSRKLCRYAKGPILEGAVERSETGGVFPAE